MAGKSKPAEGRHDKVNAMFRRSVKRSQVVGGEDHFTTADMNALLRQQKTVEQIREEHKPKQRKLTLDETKAALDYMEETGCKWSVAVAYVTGAVDQATKDARDINALIRGTRGQTIADMLEEEGD